MKKFFYFTFKDRSEAEYFRNQQARLLFGDFADDYKMPSPDHLNALSWIIDDSRSEDSILMGDESKHSTRIQRCSIDLLSAQFFKRRIWPSDGRQLNTQLYSMLGLGYERIKARHIDHLCTYGLIDFKREGRPTITIDSTDGEYEIDRDYFMFALFDQNVHFDFKD